MTHHATSGLNRYPAPRALRQEIARLASATAARGPASACALRSGRRVARAPPARSALVRAHADGSISSDRARARGSGTRAESREPRAAAVLRDPRLRRCPRRRPARRRSSSWTGGHVLFVNGARVGAAEQRPGRPLALYEVAPLLSRAASTASRSRPRARRASAGSSSRSTSTGFGRDARRLGREAGAWTCRSRRDRAGRALPAGRVGQAAAVSVGISADAEAGARSVPSRVRRAGARLARPAEPTCASSAF